MSLSLDNVVTVNVSTTAAAPVQAGFGIGLVLDKSTTLPLEARVREYQGLPALLLDFPSNTEAYKAGVKYFGRTPSPQTFAVGRMFTTAQSGKLRGAAVSATIGDYTGITNGGFDITINGVLKQIFALDFSAAANLPAVAALIQTKLAAAVAGTTCTWDATNKWFLVTIAGTTGTGSTTSYAAGPTGGSSPTDQSAFLGFTFAAGGRAYQGIAIETETTAIAACKLFDPNWFDFGCTTAFTTAEQKALMAYAEANVTKFFYTSSDSNALGLGDTGNIFYYAKNLGYQHTFGQFSSLDPYAVFSVMGLENLVNYDQPNGVITDKFKKEPGVPIEPLTQAQATALKSYNANYYVDRGGFAMIEEGVMADGTFSDQVTGLFWYQGKVQNNVFTAMATIPGRLAQTDEDVRKLLDAMDQAGDAAVTCGLFAPGKWNGANLGERKSGDYLAKAYYSYAPPVATMTKADRDARKSPQLSQICTGAGAIHSANVAVNFQS